MKKEIYCNDDGTTLDVGLTKFKVVSLILSQEGVLPTMEILLDYDDVTLLILQLQRLRKEMGNG